MDHIARSRSEAADYRALVRDIRATVLGATPAASTVVVATKGDPDLVALDGRRALPVLEEPDGSPAVHHPRSSREVVDRLRAAASGGPAYFVLPATHRWWLDHYAELRRYLDGHCQPVLDHEATCAIYALPSPEPRMAQPTAPTPGPGRDWPQVQSLLAALLPQPCQVAVLGPAGELFRLDGATLGLVPQGEPGGPTCDADRLERLHDDGAYLVVPAEARWWLAERPQLEDELDRSWRRLLHQRWAATVYLGRQDEERQHEQGHDGPSGLRRGRQVRPGGRTRA